MTFTDIVESMGTSRNAAKRSSMSGYVWKFTSAKNGLAALVDEGDYRLSFVQRDGDQYIYTWDASAGTYTYNGKVAAAENQALDNATAPTVGNPLNFDALLMKHIATGNDWSTGKQEDYEGVRLPSPGTEW